MAGSNPGYGRFLITPPDKKDRKDKMDTIIGADH